MLKFKKKIVRIHKEERRTYKTITDEYGISKASISKCLTYTSQMYDGRQGSIICGWYFWAMVFNYRLFVSFFINKKFQKASIEFKVPLSNVELYRLKKVWNDQERVFIENIEGEDLNFDL